MADSRYEVAATGIKAIIDAVYDAEGFKAKHDDLHESLGYRRVEIGISPLRITPLPSNQSVDQTFIKIQFYGLYKREVDPELQINPFTVAAYHDRLATALETQQATDPDSNAVWYYQIVNTEFPRDPTGNKSRFEMTVRALGGSPGLGETTG